VTAPRVAAVIPARNEEPTVAGVVEAALASSVVDTVVVVDNGSDDGTAAAAKRAGAVVVECLEPGKGQAMVEGVAATDADLIVFLDADLLGLRPEHVERLVLSVLDGGSAMACGLFDRGPLMNPLFLRYLPILTGQRAMRRELFEVLEPDDVRGYKVEAALNSLCNELGVHREAFVLDGLWHRTKEEKFANPVEGFARKQGMLLTAAWSYASFRLRRIGRRRARRHAH